MSASAREKTFNKRGILRTLFFLFLIVPFFPAEYITNTISWAGKAFAVWQLIVAASVVILIIKNHLIKKLSPIILLLEAIFLVMTIATVVSGESIKNPLQYAFVLLIYFLVFEYGILKDLRHFLQAQIIYFGGLTILNFLSIVVFPQGLYNYLDHYEDTWLLGFKSGHIVFLIAFLFFTALYMVLCDKRAKYVLWGGVLISFATTFLAKARAPMLVLIPIIIFAFIPQLLKFTKVLNILTYTGISVFLNLLLVVFRGQELFRWLIVGIFHRRMDLTFRTEVWDYAIQNISEKPVIGHGMQTFVYSDEIITTHNQFLEILFKTGIVGLIIFLTILVLVIIKLFKNRKETPVQWISVFLGAFLFLFVLEQFSFESYFYILIFAVNCSSLLSLAEGTGKPAFPPAGDEPKKMKTQFARDE